MALNALLVSEQDRVWIGADPGGKKNFGLAILKAEGSARTWCVDCADEAIAVVVEHKKTTPAGVDVDAPLKNLSTNRDSSEQGPSRFWLAPI